MPIAAFSTCVLIVKVIGIEVLAKEVTKSSEFKRRKLYDMCIKYLAPICLVVILISSVANAFGWISM